MEQSSLGYSCWQNQTCWAIWAELPIGMPENDVSSKFTFAQAFYDKPGCSIDVFQSLCFELKHSFSQNFLKLQSKWTWLITQKAW